MSVLMGWYVPVTILMVRDPLVRTTVVDVACCATRTVAREVGGLVYWGLMAVLRRARRARHTADVPTEPWVVVPG